MSRILERAGRLTYGGIAVAALSLTFVFGAPVVRGGDGTTTDVGPNDSAEDLARTPADVAMDLDFLIAAAWRDEGLEPSEPCTDEEFVRRVYLDIVGTIPSADQVQAFVDATGDDKREALVDELLATPGYARHFTNLWAKTLVGQSSGGNDREYSPELFRHWLEGELAAETPYADWVTEMLTATGTVWTEPALNFQGRRDHGATDMAGSVAKAFLGVQIQCAQCHDHPYEDITQADFNGMAAFWARMGGQPTEIDYSLAGPAAERRATARYERYVKEAMEKGQTAEQAQKYAARRRQKSLRVFDVTAASFRAGNRRQQERQRRRMMQRLTKKLGDIAKVQPQFLHGDEFDDESDTTRREALAGWILDTENPYTARALSNRYWGWLLGRGFVHPIDDFNSVNIPSVPAALDVLTDDTADHDFDLKRLVRIITRTRAYQLSSRSPERSSHAEEFFAVGPLKQLSPQQTFDSLQMALGLKRDGTKLSGRDASAPSSIDMGARGGAMMGRSSDATRAERTLNAAARSFFQTFEDDEQNESEEFSGTIPQGLFLMNSKIVNELLVSPRFSVIPIVIDKFDGESARIDHLFLRTLSRLPTADERRTMSRFVKRAESVDDTITEPTTGKKRRRRRTEETRREAAYADVLWALVSSSEFASNH